MVIAANTSANNTIIPLPLHNYNAPIGALTDNIKYHSLLLLFLGLLHQTLAVGYNSPKSAFPW